MYHNDYDFTKDKEQFKVKNKSFLKKFTTIFATLLIKTNTEKENEKFTKQIEFFKEIFKVKIDENNIKNEKEPSENK